MRDNDSQMVGNSGKKQTCFCSDMVTDFSPGDAHVGFEMVNGPVHNSPYFIEGTPFIGIPLDAGEHAEVHVFVSVSGTSSFRRTAGLLTITDLLPFYHMNFRTDPLVAVRASLLMAAPGVFHIEGTVLGASRVAVDVIADFFKSTLIPGIIRDKGPGEMELLFQESIGFNRIKGGIAEEGIRSESGVE